VQVAGSGNDLDRRFDVTPMESATFSLSALRVGAVTFSAAAYAAGCQLLDPASAPPTWCGADVQTTIVAGKVVTVSLALRHCGAAAVSVSFAGDDGSAPQPDAGLPDASPPEASQADAATDASALDAQAGSDGAIIVSDCPAAMAAAAPFAGGSGTLADPYLICTLAQLDRIRGSFLTQNFSLRSDLDASPTNPSSPAVKGSAWDNGGLGWNPIGGCGADGACNTADDAPFLGTFAGNGHTISNLYIRRTNQDGVGLFGMMSTSGTAVQLRGLTLANVNITGQSQVGAAVGFARGSIDHCVSSGTVAGSASSVDSVGGLVGMMGTPGGPQSTKTLSASSSSATVSGVANVGGLAGHLEWGGAVSQSSASGTVTAQVQVGGLVGYMYECNINNSFASGPVKGVNCIGGLVGFMDFSNVGTSYASGAVTGTDQVGGLIGCGGNTPIAHSFAMGVASGSTTKVGGLIGEEWDDEIVDCKWDSTPPRPLVMCGFIRPDDPGSGCDDTQGVSGQPQYWNNTANPPMSAWNPALWTFTPGAPPTL
jgi:hypothetical protein